MAKQWIQKATEKMERKGTVGSLHRALGVPEDKPIPAAKLASAKNSPSASIRKKANFAANVKK